MAERRRRAVSEAQGIADRIAYADPAVSRVYLFGSVAKQTVRSLSFDIDIAVEGGDVDTAMDVAESSSFRVDILDLDHAPEHLRSSVFQQGVLLFDRQQDPDSRQS